MSDPNIGFEMREVRLSLEQILPLRQIRPIEKRGHRFKMILSSLKEVGLVEPLVVHPQKNTTGKYLLLDGHLRFFALKDLAQTSADCIIAKDDERFTYNARINRLPPIQEHKMIMKAVRNGVKPERIAAALNVPVRIIHASMKLLDGIHDEAADMLKDKNISPKAIRLLKRVTGVRQIEIVELMVSTNNFFTGYVEALVMGTPKDQLIMRDEPKKKKDMSPEDMSKLQHEMESLERDWKSAGETYGENMFNLTCARGYIKKLLEEYCYEDYGALTEILGEAMIDNERQRVREELFLPARRQDLIQALLAPAPELSTTSDAVAQLAPTQEAADESEEPTK